MKRNLMALILALCLLSTSLAGAESLLPSLTDMIGKPMPSLGEALSRYPDEEIADVDSGNTEVFQGVTETDYNTFGVYLSEKGATLTDYQVAGTTFSATIEMDGKAISFTYDTQTLEARVTYPKGTYDEYLTAHPELAEVVTASEDKLAPFRNVGGYVTFGNYEQDNNTDNGQEPIEWLVLDYDAADNRALLISRYGLDVQPYNTEWGGITWEDCTLRAWLNGTFLNKAFTAQEQTGILLTNVDNSSSQGYWSSTNGGNNTQDKIFLLSYAEANKYFGVQHYVSESVNNTKPRVSPTAYAIKQGALTLSDYKTADGSEAGVWWLRSPGVQDNVAIVHYGGFIVYNSVNYVFACVRPALWVNLEFVENPDAQPESEAPADEESLAPFRNVSGYVTFGSYEQDNNTANGKEPIEWLVLDYDAANNRTLLISRYGLDAKPYNTELVDVTWENCTLRAWLNGEFIDTAFSTIEQGAILTTSVDNSSSQGYSEWSTSGGNNTRDKIFLLSYAEANKYLDVTWGNNSNVKSRVSPTAYAMQAGAFTIYDSYMTADGAAAEWWWWLRSPGYIQSGASCVGLYGSLISCYHDGNGCVRPALWINLESVENLAAHPEPEAPVDEETLAPFRNVGGYVTFGSYEQDNNTANGKEPIEWLVLDYDAADNRALLISRYGLDVKPYNTEWVDITWENCTLRAWLNGEFMSTTFSTIEQGAILTTSVDNSSGQGYSVWYTDGGNNTQNKIFLLSYAEANKYLGVTDEDTNNTKSQVAPTAYAIKNGAYTNNDYQTSEGDAAGFWWLRSPGYFQYSAACVDNDGSLGSYAVAEVVACVRPALWIDLDSDIF